MRVDENARVSRNRVTQFSFIIINTCIVQRNFCVCMRGVENCDYIMKCHFFHDSSLKNLKIVILVEQSDTIHVVESTGICFIILIATIRNIFFRG